MKDIKHIRRNFDTIPGFGTMGAGGQIFNFLNMVMWHIKLKGMSSRQGYTEICYPRIKLMTLGWGQRVKINTISFLQERGDKRCRAIECFLVNNLIVDIKRYT